jgi:Bacteriophage T4, Gp8
MSSLITNNFRNSIANQFINYVNTNNLYLFISRSQNWNTDEYTNNPAVSELTPPVPLDNADEIQRIYNNMIAIKKVNITDLSLVVKKNLWTAGTIYDMYKHDYSLNKPTASGSVSLIDSNFYVVNSSFQVFKCIYNGQTPETLLGVPTTTGSEPVVTGSPTATITTNDGYKWKFLYTLTTNQVIKFANNNYIPIVKDPIISAAAISGSVSAINITNRGSNLNTGIFYAPIYGNGTGGVVKITVSGDSNSPFYQKISQVDIISAGLNFTNAFVDLSQTYSNIALSTISPISTGLTNPKSYLEVIISPIGGHGSNPELELGAYRVIVAPILDSIDGDVPIGITYRQYGLLASPTIAGSNTPFTGATACVLRRIKFPSTSVGTFIPGNIITQTASLASGLVVSWDVVNKILTYLQNQYTNNIDFVGNSDVSNGSGVVAQPDSTFSGTIANSTFVSGYAGAEVQKNSGEIIYIENRTSIQRNLDQQEQIKIVFEF